MKTSEHIQRLFIGYIFGELTKEHKKELDDWRLLRPEHEQLFQKETDRERLRKGIQMMRDSKERIWQKINERYTFPDERTIKKTARVHFIRKIAAVFVLLAGIALIYLYNRPDPIRPGTNHAYFEGDGGLGSGMDDFRQGLLQGLARVFSGKNKYGEEVLRATDQPEFGKDKYFTLFTPRGAQFCLQLPDSTLIWVNAQSKIRFPANFSGDSVQIFIEGESYFEISKNRKIPMHIFVGGLHLEASDAQLNVRSYPGEPTKVSLLNGQFRLLFDSVDGPANAPVILDTGKLVILDHHHLTIQKDTDRYSAIAWRNGRTYFKQVNIQTLMTAISRWYNVDIFYEGQIPTGLYDVDLPRDAPFNTILERLKELGIKVEVKGRLITIKG